MEMTVEADADAVTEKCAALSEVTPGQRGTSETGQAEATADEEVPMDLGKSELDTPQCKTTEAATCGFLSEKRMKLVDVHGALM